MVTKSTINTWVSSIDDYTKVTVDVVSEKENTQQLTTVTTYQNTNTSQTGTYRAYNWLQIQYTDTSVISSNRYSTALPYFVLTSQSGTTGSATQNRIYNTFGYTTWEKKVPTPWNNNTYITSWESLISSKSTTSTEVELNTVAKVSNITKSESTTYIDNRMYSFVSYQNYQSVISTISMETAYLATNYSTTNETGVMTSIAGNLPIYALSTKTSSSLYFPGSKTTVLDQWTITDEVHVHADSYSDADYASNSSTSLEATGSQILATQNNSAQVLYTSVFASVTQTTSSVSDYYYSSWIYNDSTLTTSSSSMTSLAYSDSYSTVTSSFSYTTSYTPIEVASTGIYVSKPYLEDQFKNYNEYKNPRIQQSVSTIVEDMFEGLEFDNHKVQYDTDPIELDYVSTYSVTIEE